MTLSNVTRAELATHDVDHAQASSMGCHGEHQAPAADTASSATPDHRLGEDGSPKACCDAGVCFCSCSVSLSALVPSVAPAFLPPQTGVVRWAVGIMPATPRAQPFRPPIV